MAVLLIAAVVAIGLAGGGDEDAAPTTVATTAPASPRTTATTQASATSGPATAAELARSTVILLPSLDGRPCWNGSGTVVSDDGLILTNFHVIEPDDACPWDTLVVGVTGASDEPPVPTYQADVLVFDAALDLAVVRIARTLDGEPVGDDIGIRPIELGDSDAIDLGDRIRILGYPGIGGETITFTQGTVSGFGSEPGVGNRAWIKTDATIAGGNSGGTALDEANRLIGVPSIAGAGGDTDSVDCRYLADTNGDGVIDGSDSCVPVGGFINGLRPVALALPLIEEAATAEPFRPPSADAGEPATVAPDSNGVEVQVDGGSWVANPLAVPTGVGSICIRFLYEGMADGIEYNASWFIDGELADDHSSLGATWNLGAEGDANYCTTEGAPLPDGVHELVLTVGSGEDAQELVAESMFVGGDHPRITIDIINESSLEVCLVNITPTGAQSWGPDRIAGFTIAPGVTEAVPAVAGPLDVLIIDCNGNDMFRSVDENVFDDGTFITLRDA